MLLIKNRRVKDPRLVLTKLLTFWLRKKIRRIGQNLQAEGAKYDASGLVVAPGLVDICAFPGACRLIRLLKIFIRGLCVAAAGAALRLLL